MRALVWHGPEQLSVEDVGEPEAVPGEVLLVPEAVGVCGSEVEGYLGLQANRTPPLVMGHELAGHVVAAGDDAGAGWMGRRAAVNPLIASPRAHPGRENLDPDRRLIGVHRPGGFAGLVAVPSERLRELPQDADARLAALAEPLANGVHAARVGRDGAEGDAGTCVAVLGAGTIGLMALQAVAVGGGVAHVTVLEPQAERRGLAGTLGAGSVCADAGELRATVRDASGDEGADVVIDAVGAEATRRLALELLRPGGCAVMLGLATDTAPVDFHPLVRGGLTIRGSYAYTDEEYDTALGWLLDGRAGLAELEPVLPLAAGPEAFAQLAAGPGARVKVFLGP